MSKLEVISWNLSDHINSTAVQSAITNADFDIGVFPEAAAERYGVRATTERAFNRAGYDVYSVNYDDDDGRKDRHAMAVLVKPELVASADRIRLAGRTTLRLGLENDVDFVGLHLDDRSEFSRIQQVWSLLDHVASDAVISGDFNAMHKADNTARLLRALHKPVRMLPAKNPGEVQNKLERIGSLSQRLTDMATGITMEMLNGAGFQDADPSHAPTMRMGPLAVQLDRLMHRGAIQTVQPTTVESAAGLSDHSRIRAIVSGDR